MDTKEQEAPFGGDPMASFSILPEERIDDEMRERIENAMRHDLKSLEGSYEG